LNLFFKRRPPPPEPPPTPPPATLTPEEWAAYRGLARAIAGGPARAPEQEEREISLDGGQTWQKARQKIRPEEFR
jgi:hypothetical protein